MSETTQPVRLTGLIPNSHTPCRLNCLLGDRITSLSSSDSSLFNFRGDQKHLALDPCLPLPPSMDPNILFLHCKVDPTGQQARVLWFRVGRPVRTAVQGTCRRKLETARGREGSLQHHLFPRPRLPEHSCTLLSPSLCGVHTAEELMR